MASRTASRAPAESAFSNAGTSLGSRANASVAAPSSSSSKGSSGFASSSRSSGYGPSTSSSGYSNTMAVRLAEFKMDAPGRGGPGTSHAGLDTTVDPESLTPEDYLDRFGITAYLREAVNLVLENRPQAPVEFLSEYFRNAVQGSSYLHRAYRFVRIQIGPTSFMSNGQAHRVLSRRKGSVGVTGEKCTNCSGCLPRSACYLRGCARHRTDTTPAH